MTAFRAERVAPLFALIAGLAAATATAEEFTRPPDVVAPLRPATSSRPPPSRDPSGAAPIDTGSPTGEPTPRPAAPVAATPVPAGAPGATGLPALESAGLLSAAASGLPAAMWKGTSVSVARLAIASLPAAPPSRTLRDVQFRLLAMSATSPVADGVPGASLFALRLERLAAMGEGEILNELLRAAEGDEDEALTRMAVDALLMAGERTAACTRFERLAADRAGGWWDQARLTCRALARDREGVAASLEAVRRDGDVDPVFLDLAVRAAGGAARPLPDTFHPTGPIVALLDATGTLLPEGELARALPPLLRSAVETSAIPLARRVALAEKAESLGVLEPERLGELYVGHAADGSARGPAAERARLFVVVKNAPDDASVLAALAGADSPALGGVVRASVRRFAVLPPQGSAPVAVAGMRAMLHLGDFAGARRWHGVALRDGGGGQAALHVLPLAVLAGIVEADDSWNRRWVSAAAGRSARDRAIVASLAAGLGLPGVAAAAASGLADAIPDAPAAHRVALVREAVGAGRVAEALAGMLSLADEGPLAELHPATAGLIVETLRGVGLALPARAFAVEYALAAGL